MPGLLWIVIWPYHMTFRHSTLDPISGIARAVTFKKKEDVVEALNLWRAAKDEELQFVKIASTVSAGAVIGVFSWPDIGEGFWIATGLWHCSLMLSILAGIQSAQQGWLLIRMPPLQAHSASQDDVRLVLRSVLLQALDGSLPVCDTSGHVTGKEKIDWNMVYIWQVPIMLMTYAWVTFFLAMTLHVCTPLIEADPWGRGHKIAIFYLAAFGVLGANFAYCSFWAYKNAQIPSHGKPSRWKAFKPPPQMKAAPLMIAALERSAYAEKV